MSIEIREVTDRKALGAFIAFPHQLYKGNPNYVPPLRFDELSTLRKDKNPAFDYCEARYWLAYKSGRVVGRIAGIINHAHIDKWKQKQIRFGWIDFEEDLDVLRALLDKVEAWGRERGLDAIHGPLGFTDLDFEGMLVDGFEHKGTLAALYNYPYYPKLLESAGYQKHTDWLEYRVTVPRQMDERLKKLADLVERRLGLSVVPLKKSKDVLPYASQVFELINSAYSDLYSTVPLTEKQIRYYTSKYFSFIKPEFVKLVVNREDRLVAFSITMPSLTGALQRAKGRLFPFGFVHLLKAMRGNHLADLLLIAVHPKLQGKGVNALLLRETLSSYVQHGIRYAEAGHQLEDNKKVLAIWNNFDAKPHKRRRCYIKALK
jgi:GNAT superfamily N-acetyltransferase